MQTIRSVIKSTTVLDLLFAASYTALLYFLWPAPESADLRPLRALILSILCLELAYFLVAKFRLTILSGPVTSKPPHHKTRQAMTNFLKLPSVFDMHDFLEGWFLGAPHTDVKRGNVEDLVAYGFYCESLHQLDPDKRRAVEEFIDQVESTWNYTLEPGYNKNIKYMAHLWEPLRVVHKPLMVYLLTGILARIAHAFLHLMGFAQQYHGSFSCWIKQPPASTINKKKRVVTVHKLDAAVHTVAEQALDVVVNATSAVAASVTMQHPHQGQQYHLPHTPHILPSTSNLKEQQQPTSPSNSAALAEIKPTPLVFIHGVGFGCLPYLHFFKDLIKACGPQHAIIVIEVPQVAMRFCWEAVSVDDVATAAVAAVKAAGYNKACFIGHSYGSFCVSRIQQLYPDVVDSVVLIDPATLLIFYPQLLYNFIYKSPLDVVAQNSYALSLSTFIDLARFACSRDLIIAQAFCRKFHWTELTFWPEDVPDKSLIVLSGRDDLVPSELVQLHFKLVKHPAKVLMHPDLGHGGFLANAKHMARIVQEIRALVVVVGGEDGGLDS